MRPLTLDTETDLIRPGRQAPDLACVAFSVQGSRWLRHWTNYRDDFTAALLDRSVLIVGHTIAYDMAVLGNEYPESLPYIFAAYNENRITDTEIREKLLDIARGCYRGFVDINGTVVKLNYGLDPLAKRLLGRTLDKNTWRLRYGEFIPYPLERWPQGAREYPLEDVRATEDIFTAQETPENVPYLGDQYRQARAAFWLRLMSCWGIVTDPIGVRELARKTKQEYEAIARDLRAAGLLRADRPVKRRTGVVEIEPGSRNTKLAKQMIDRAYSQRGLPTPRTDSGDIATDDRACKESGDPLLAKYGEFASLGAILNKDIPTLEQGCGRTPIHTRIESLLETGRTSSSGNADDGGMNIQNPRRKGGVRECFVPRAGYVFVDSDYSGAELCGLGQVCIRLLGGSALAEAMNTGRDPHLMIASQILGRTYEEIKGRHEQGAGEDCRSAQGKCHCSYCIVDDARQTGKVANFGFPGGLGYKALIEFALAQYDVRLSEEQSRDLKRAWLQTWPEMREYFRYVDWTVKQGIPIQQLFSGRFRGDSSYTARCNTLFQGLIADLTKDAGWRITEACYVKTESPLFGCRVVDFIHDQFLTETPEHRGHEAAHEQVRLMNEAARTWLPDCPPKAKPMLARRWSKKAKPVYDASGRLVPWG